MKDGVKEIVGKRIKGVVVKAKDKSSSDCQVFLIFSDDSYYEFYADCDFSGIFGTGGVDRGSLEAVERYLSSHRVITFQYIDDNITD